LVLLHIADHPGATNREIAMATGIRNDAQVSRILGRLLDLGLAVNRTRPPGSGGPDAWHLTPAGRLVAEDARHHGRVPDTRAREQVDRQTSARVLVWTVGLMFCAAVLLSRWKRRRQ
jgi:MarR family protein